MSFLLYAALLTRPVAGLADVYGQTQMARGAFTRLRQAMEEPPEPAGHVGIPLPAVKGDIEFRGVSFSYGGRPPALGKVDLHVAAGELQRPAQTSKVKKQTRRAKAIPWIPCGATAARRPANRSAG